MTKFARRVLPRRRLRRARGVSSPSPRAAQARWRTPSRRSAPVSSSRAETERAACTARRPPLATPRRRFAKSRMSTKPARSPASSPASRTSPPPTSSWTTRWRCSAVSAKGGARAAPCTRRRRRTTRATRAWRRRRSRRMPRSPRTRRRRKRATGSTIAFARWRPLREPGTASVASARSRRWPTRSWSSSARRARRFCAGAPTAASATARTPPPPLPRSPAKTCGAKTRFREPAKSSASNAESSPRTTRL
mmetsp:Transcript_13402/g.56282  ORF Transcript_13402/g.56282 Transcript_13402/m.56282 type:complete len:250 (-) Transcript_13402:1550-2299(-)